ncbi:peptidase dimerization domain-containing protein [Lentisalinibacter orientalis]|uniref:peptidase dimerization domain-containing protein n=1 Tax=Lentisalinibacter orientalis TaxID=2992241 RepID=UPI00386E5BA0
MDELAERVWQTVRPQELIELLMGMVDIPSPSGDELPLAHFLVDHMRQNDIEATVQAIGENQANAIGRIRGGGDGQSLLFYSPIDTAFSGDPAEDGDNIDLEKRQDQIPKARLVDNVVSGLGAHNPKGHAASAVMAAVALRRANIGLAGDLSLGMCGGGMPTAPRPSQPPDIEVGHGIGCHRLLQYGGIPDRAIVAKPGPVAFEEVGVTWFRIRVRGILGYAGTRHVVKHRNPIIEAARVVERLENWFSEYSERHRSGSVAPQGSIGAVRSGWQYKPTFIGEWCDLYIDLRVSPRTSLQQVRREVEQAVSKIAEELGDIEIVPEMLFGIPGSHTDANDSVVKATIAAWEYANEKGYEAPKGGSGATEANVLRLWGVPTARVGMPPPPHPLEYSGQFSMGEAHLSSLETLCRTLIHAALTLCVANH